MQILYNSKHVETLKEKWRCPVSGAFHHLVAAYTALDDLIESGVDCRFSRDLVIVQYLENAIQEFEENHEVINVFEEKVTP